ncbi:MAG: hypothetical protein ABIU05_25580 [Nitrospirales bacterium]
MAQEFLSYWISGHLQRWEAEKVRAALKRMRLLDDPAKWDSLRWELLDWFVRFSKLDLTALTEDECGLLDEEVQTVELLHARNMSLHVPTRAELLELQVRVRKPLSALVDAGCARMGPLQVEFVVWRGNAKVPESQRARGVVIVQGTPSLIGHPPPEGIAFQVPPIGPNALIHCLARLLEKYPGAVRRCPRCDKIFAQFRRSAVYCSRVCQSQAAAQKQWEKKKQDALKRQSKRIAKRQGRKVVRHGTKTRKR